MLDRMNYEDILKIIADRYKEILKGNLVGIYVYGSIAFNCFDHDKSSIDFIVVIKNKISTALKEELIELLLDLNQFAPKKGFEMSVVLLENTQNFKYQIPFELYFSNAYITSCRKDLTKYCETMKGIDKDLAAHFTEIKKVGITIYGLEINKVFSERTKDF